MLHMKFLSQLTSGLPQAIAYILDGALYVLLVATVAIILYKILDLWFPAKLGRQAPDSRMGEGDCSMSEALDELESGLAVLAVIAAAAPFIGLAGTVLHIMVALRGMGAAGADFSVVSGPVVEALNATLLGLASAVPAAVAHALMQRRLQLLENKHRRRLRREVRDPDSGE